MIDWERVTELRSEIGMEGFTEVVELFLDEVERVLMTLGKRPERLEEDLHFLKGSALNLGFRAFSRLCQIGEKMSADGHAQDVDTKAILDCYAESKLVFIARLDEFTKAA